MLTRRFRPSWPALIATTVVVLICLRLALWQLERADTKARWLTQYSERQQLGPQPLNQLLRLEDAANFSVSLSGTIDNHRPILLDNRIIDRVAGYHLLSPMKTDDGHWVLVNRGWLPRGLDRNQLPDIPIIDGNITVDGHTYLYSERTFTLADDDLSNPQWPLLIQKVETEALSEALGVELAPFEIRVAANSTLEAEAQLPRIWQDNRLGPERHYGYAFQWFAMAIAAFIFFLVASLRRPAGLSQDANE